MLLKSSKILKYSLIAFYALFLFLSSCKKDTIILDDLNLQHAFSFENFDGYATIQYAAIHCSASNSKTYMTGKDIMRVAKERGFSRPPYHYFIRRNGIVDTLCKLDLDDVISPEEVCWGVAGYNSRTIQICYEGCFVDKPNEMGNMTIQQKLKTIQITSYWKTRISWLKVQGHNEFPKVKKACPGFKASKFYQ